jgi:hypothetical protein
MADSNLYLLVTPDLDGHPWIDVEPGAYAYGVVERCGISRRGIGGEPTIVLMLRLQDGSVVIGETTITLAREAATAVHKAIRRPWWRRPGQPSYVVEDAKPRGDVL